MTKNEEQIIMQIYENLSKEIEELKNNISEAMPAHTSSESTCCTIPAQQKFIDIQAADNKNIKDTLWHISRLLVDIATIINSDKVPRWLRELSDQNQNLRNYAGKLDDMLVELQEANKPISPNAHSFTFKFEFKNKRTLFSFIGILILLVISIAINLHQAL